MAYSLISTILFDHLNEMSTLLSQAIWNCKALEPKSVAKQKIGVNFEIST